MTKGTTFDILSDLVEQVVWPEQEIPPGMGKCTGCGELIHPGQDDWDGEDGNHYPEFDMGGGDVRKFECGPVHRGEK